MKPKQKTPLGGKRVVISLKTLPVRVKMGTKRFGTEKERPL